MTGERVTEIRERLADAAAGDDAELKAEAETDLAYLLAEIDAARAARDRILEDRRKADGLLREARGLLDHDRATILAEVEKLRERQCVQWEEARAERAERIAELSEARQQLAAVEALANAKWAWQYPKTEDYQKLLRTAIRAAINQEGKRDE